MTGDRATAAHRSLVETERLLNRAHVKLTAAADAYPDDTGKIVPYAITLGKLSEVLMHVKALDVSAQAWKAERS